MSLSDAITFQCEVLYSSGRWFHLLMSLSICEENGAWCKSQPFFFLSEGFRKLL